MQDRVNCTVIRLNETHLMATPKRKNGRRRITVDETKYIWDPTKWESTGFLTIRHADGHPASIKVSPLCILLPKQIAACIRFAIHCGWVSDSNQTIWLGYKENDDIDDIFEIAPDAKPSWDAELQEWTLPRMP